MTPKKEKARLQAPIREAQEWKDRVSAAEQRAAAISDVDDLAAALRDVLLANADYRRFRYGVRAAEDVAVERRRANSERFLRVLALYHLAKRLLKTAEQEHDMTPEEAKTRDARIDAESRALRSVIDSLLGN